MLLHRLRTASAAMSFDIRYNGYLKNREAASLSSTSWQEHRWRAAWGETGGMAGTVATFSGQPWEAGRPQPWEASSDQPREAGRLQPWEASSDQPWKPWEPSDQPEWSDTDWQAPDWQAVEHVDPATDGSDGTDFTASTAAPNAASTAAPVAASTAALMTASIAAPMAPKAASTAAPADVTVDLSVLTKASWSDKDWQPSDWQAVDGSLPATDGHGTVPPAAAASASDSAAGPANEDPQPEAQPLADVTVSAVAATVSATQTESASEPATEPDVDDAESAAETADTVHREIRMRSVQTGVASWDLLPPELEGLHRHCDGGIGADIGAGVNVSDNSTESTHFAGSPTAWPRGSPQRPPADAMQDAVMGCDLKCCCNLVKPHRNDEVSLDMKV